MKSLVHICFSSVSYLCCCGFFWNKALLLKFSFLWKVLVIFAWIPKVFSFSFSIQWFYCNNTVALVIMGQSSWVGSVFFSICSFTIFFFLIWGIFSYSFCYFFLCPCFSETLNISICRLLFTHFQCLSLWVISITF